MTDLTKYLQSIQHLPIDAFIVVIPVHLDPSGRAGAVEIHLSTANTTSAASAAFWADQGVKRIILARELTLEEIEYRSRGPSA